MLCAWFDPTKLQRVDLNAIHACAYQLAPFAVILDAIPAASSVDISCSFLINLEEGRSGADNLDVPASLFDLLNSLKAAGYTTGELPATPEALLDRIMAHGVNLPEDLDENLLQEIVGIIGCAQAVAKIGTQLATRAGPRAGQAGKILKRGHECVLTAPFRTSPGSN